MHDAIQFEAKGIPSALIITEPFRPIVAGFAPTIGAAGFIGCEVPHPVSTQDDVSLQKIAKHVADAVVAQLSA